MDNVLRCSIIFMILHIFSVNYGLASINPITNTMYNKVIRQQNSLDPIFSNEPDDQYVPRLKVHNPLTNFDSYDFDDYYHGGEELDSSENTQSIESDYNDNEEYGEDESLMSVDKRGRHSQPRRQGKRTDRLVDLCPVTEENYRIKEDWKQRGYVLRDPHTELACNHTKTHKGYDRQYNRVCYPLGRTFEYGHGTHCFQRYVVNKIEVKSISGDKDDYYIETRFRYGCTCGWATDELGSIHDYHYDKILNLCSEIRDKV